MTNSDEMKVIIDRLDGIQKQLALIQAVLVDLIGGTKGLGRHTNIKTEDCLTSGGGCEDKGTGG